MNTSTHASVVGDASHPENAPMDQQHEQADSTITASSRVTVGLLWTLLVGGLVVTVFFWGKFDALDDRFVTKELFNARMASLEKQIDRLEAALERHGK